MISLLVYGACAALILFTIRELKSEYAVLGGIFVTVSLCLGVVGLLSQLLSALREYLQYDIGEYVGVMFKVAGVCICVDVCSDICAQCGYTSVAKGVLMYGKAQLLLIVLPYIKELVSGVSSLF